MVNARSFVHFGWRTCISVASTSISLALKTLFNPVRTGYIRYHEFPFVASQIPNVPHLKVLDLSSPKHLALYLAHKNRDWSLHAVDLDDAMFPDYKKYINSIGLDNVLLGKMSGTRLPYKDGAFDIAFSVSAIEHFDGNGDSLAMKEIERILRPGGTFVLTIPYGAQYQEIFWDRDVYSRKYKSEKLFFSRIYDNDSLQKRILSQCEMKVSSKKYIGQTRVKIFNFENMWDKTPPPIRMPLQLISPFISQGLYGDVAKDWFDTGSTGLVMLTFKKAESVTS